MGLRLRCRDRSDLESPRSSRTSTAKTDRPDGGAVDSEGCYWSAFYRGGKVVRLSPQGKLLAEYPLPAMCPTMCAFGGPDLRTIYVTSARQKRDADELARLPQSGGIFAHARRHAGPGRTEVRELTPIGRPCNSIPPPTFASTRSSSLGTSVSGASFATSTGDILEVGMLRPGRVARARRTQYPARLRACRRAARNAARSRNRRAGVWSFTAGDTRLELTGTPLRFRLLHDGQPVLTSITDEHFRGFTRLPVIGRARGAAQWVSAFALASGEPVYGLGEKFGPLNKRGQIVHSHVEDALGVNTGLSYKNAPFCWSPCAGKNAWGIFVNTPGRVTHGVGHPDWSHRSYGIVVDDEALDLFLIAGRDPAQIIDRYTQLTGRAPDVPLWGLGLWVSKAYYRTRRRSDRRRRQIAPAQDSLRCADPRRTRGVGRADALRLPVGFAALSAARRGAVAK